MSLDLALFLYATSLFKMSTENTEGSSEEMKTVLCVFKERRRPVTFRTSNDAQVERKHLLEAVRVSFADVISSGEGTSASSSYFLQTESPEWGGMVDVTGCVEDRAIVHLCYESAEPVSTIVFIIIFYLCVRL